MASRRGKAFAGRTGGGFGATQEKSGVHPSMLKQARKSGQLNLSGRSLTEGGLKKKSSFYTNSLSS